LFLPTVTVVLYAGIEELALCLIRENAMLL